MKPTKNRVYCVGIKRLKMLFETEGKANNFIRFNKDEMIAESGKAPVRSYYCQFCLGWHVTSNPDKEIGEMLDEMENQMLEEVKKIRDANRQRTKVLKEELNKHMSLFMQRVSNVENSLIRCDFERAEELLNEGQDLYCTELNHAWKGKEKRVQKYQNLSTMIAYFNWTLLGKGEAPQDADWCQNDDFCQQIVANYQIKLELEQRLSVMQEVLETDQQRFDCEAKRVGELFAKVAGGSKSSKNTFQKQFKAKVNMMMETYNSLYHKKTSPELPVKKSREKQLRRDEERRKSVLLDVIGKMETLYADYEAGDLKKCETTIDVCNLILSGRNLWNDEVADKLRKQLRVWSEKLMEESDR